MTPLPKTRPRPLAGLAATLCLAALVGCSTRPANLNARVEPPAAAPLARPIGQPTASNWNAVLPARIASDDQFALSEGSQDFGRRDARLGMVRGSVGESVNYYPGPAAPSLDRPYRISFPRSADQTIIFRPRTSYPFERANHR